MSERMLEALMAVVIGFIVTIALALLIGLVGCRKPPTTPPDPPSDAGGDAGPAFDGSISDCVSLPNLNCSKLSQEASEAGEVWQNGQQSALDPVWDDLASAMNEAGGMLCGQTSAGVVHYLGDDSQVHEVFADRMDGWTNGPLIFLDPCGTLQDFEREGLVIRLRTRRAQGSFSLQVRVAP